MLKKVKVWIQASRALYTITVLLPCCIGALMAWYEGATFRWGVLALTLVAMMFANIGTNFVNDFHDWKSGVDKLDEGRIYKKGAEVLYDNPLAESGSVDGFALYFFSPTTILISALVSLGITAAIGLYFVFAVEWRVLILGIIGIVGGYFYTAPPIQLGYRGFGDLVCFLGCGPLPVLGTYLLFTHTITPAAVLASVVVGLLVTAILYIGNVPDAEADKQVGKKTVSVVLGRQAVKVLAPLYYTVAFGLLVLGVVLGLFPAWALLACLTLPIVYRIVKVTRQYYNDVPSFAPSIMMTVQTFAISTVLLGVGLVLGRIL